MYPLLTRIPRRETLQFWTIFDNGTNYLFQKAQILTCSLKWQILSLNGWRRIDLKIAPDVTIVCIEEFEQVALVRARHEPSTATDTCRTGI